MKLTRELTKLRTISRNLYKQEVNDTYERLLSLERNSRDYSLRFYNISESTGEDCIAKLRDILGNDLQLQPSIENTHRIGPFIDDGTPRPILAKFLYRPERFSTSLVLSRRKGISVMVRVFRMIWYGKTVKRRSNWDLLWKRHLKLRKDLDFIMASYTLTVRYIRLEILNSIHICIRVSPILNIYIALLLSFTLNYSLLIFDKQKLYANGPWVNWPRFKCTIA